MFYDVKKMQEVGFYRFDLGLPGNLVNVPDEDYYDKGIRRWGGSNAFEVYENGGATAMCAGVSVSAAAPLPKRLIW